MELETPSVILTDTGELQLTSISRHCLLHAVEVLQPDQTLSMVLPTSGSHRIDSFCQELTEAIQAKLPKKKLASLIPEEPLMPTIEVHRFYEGATGTVDFMLLVEKNFLSVSKGNIDLDIFHRCCWKYYEMEKKSEISFPRWFSRECTYRLWLIYNCVLEPDLTTNLSLMTTNEVMKRLVEYCGYTWDPSYAYNTSNEMTFPEYLSAITTYFDKFRLEMSLTCEVIGDMVDEIVHGVLKTGKLTKKGHKRKNWKRRWFVLQRTVLRYYQSRDNMVLKGQLVLNGKTEVKSLPDKGKRKFCFHVTCGQAGTVFEIAADDQRMKHEWILAIKKAVALARVLDGSSKPSDFAESLQGFYLLKYGTSQPALTRQDSTVRKMKFHATLKDQRKRLSGRVGQTSSGPPVKDLESSGEADDQEHYVPMSPGEGNITSDDSDSEEENRYVPMFPVNVEDLLSGDPRSDSASIDVAQSLPTSSVLAGQAPPIHERASRTISGPARTPTSQHMAPPSLDPPQEGDDERAYDPVCYDSEDSKSSRKSSIQESPLLTPEDDGKEGSYIHFTRGFPKAPPTSNDFEKSVNYDEPRNWVASKDVTKSSNSHLTAPSSTNSKLDESGEYELGNTLQSTEQVKGTEQDLYLTLIPGGQRSSTSSIESEPMSPTRNGPPTVPVHRKGSSPTMSPLSPSHQNRLNMPVSETHRSSPTMSPLSPSHQNRLNMPVSEKGPPPPPRSRGSSAISTSSPNLHAHRAPPPLPKRTPDSPPMKQLYQNVKPSPTPRRCTMSPKQVQPSIKEEVTLKRVSSYDELDKNSLSPPPIPPR